MKFDFIIGNPPYQEEAVGDQKTFTPPPFITNLWTAHILWEEKLS